MKGITGRMPIFAVLDSGDQTLTIRRRTKIAATIGVVAAIATILILASLPDQIGVDEEPAPNTFEFKTIQINNTERFDLPRSIWYIFDTDFNISSLNFSGARDNFDNTYWAGAGLLIHDCEGENGTTLRIKEMFGDVIAFWNYTGSSLQVIIGMTEYWTWKNEMHDLKHTGMHKVLVDWKNGNWHPRMGLLLEHLDTANFTAGNASLFIMILEPVWIISEFSILIIPIIGVIASLAIARRKRK